MEQLIFPVTKKVAEKQGGIYSSEANKNALFPSRLRELRKEKGVSQDQLSKELGVSKSTIGLYETGDTLPDAKTLRDLAVYFDVSADWLLGLTDIKDPDVDISSALQRLGLTDDTAYMLFGIKNAQTEGKVEDIRLLSHTLNDFLSCWKLIPFLRMIQSYIRAYKILESTNKPEDVEDFAKCFEINGITIYDYDILDAKFRNISKHLEGFLIDMAKNGYQYEGTSISSAEENK